MIGPDGAPVPVVELDWSLWCDRHLAPYRPAWPQGAGPAMLLLFQAAIKMPAIIEHARGDTTNLTEALRRFKPVCCFVGRDVLDGIYAATAPGWHQS